jgi:hypothetical protein
MKEQELLQLIQKLKELGQIARSIIDSPDIDLYRARSTTPNYDTELVQIAATAVAALTDLKLQEGGQSGGRL